MSTEKCQDKEISLGSFLELKELESSRLNLRSPSGKAFLSSISLKSFTMHSTKKGSGTSRDLNQRSACKEHAKSMLLQAYER